MSLEPAAPWSRRRCSPARPGSGPTRRSLAPAGALVVKNGAAVGAVDRGGERCRRTSRSRRGSRRSCRRRLPIASRPPIWPPGDQPPAGGPAQVAVWSVDDRVARAARSSTKETLVEPPWSCSTETWPYRESWSSSRSRRSIRSFGLSPLATNELIVLFRLGELVRDLLRPRRRAPAIASYWPMRRVLRGDHLRADASGSSRSARRPAATSACLAAWSSGDLERSDQACQNFGELGVDAGVARLGERELGGVQTPRRAACQSLRFVFWRAVLRVQELVADAAEALDVDARAEVGAGRRCRRRRPGSAARARRPASASWRE